MFALRYKPSQKFFRVHQGVGTNLVPDGDLAVNNQGLLTLPDLWTATKWADGHLHGQPVEIVELEMREIRVVPPILEVKAEKDAISGEQLSITKRV